MATWTTVRNIQITATNIGCALQLSLLDYYLPLAGWKRVGCGTGTAGSSSWWDGVNNATKLFPTYPTYTGIATGAWAVWKNASGVMFMFKVTDMANGYAVNRYSPFGLYTNSGISATQEPAATLDQVTFHASYGYNFGVLGYFTFAYTTDANSWMFFGKHTSEDFCAYCIKCEGGFSSDPVPFKYMQNCRYGTNCWSISIQGHGLLDTTSRIFVPAGPTPPVNGQYGMVVDGVLTEPQMNGYTGSSGPPYPFFMIAIGVDPNSGNHQLFPVWACSSRGTSYPDQWYIPGKVTGIMRVSGALNTGDRLGLNGSNYDWMVVGDYALPWGGSEALL